MFSYFVAHIISKLLAKTACKNIEKPYQTISLGGGHGSGHGKNVQVVLTVGVPGVILTTKISTNNFVHNTSKLLAKTACKNMYKP